MAMQSKALKGIGKALFTPNTIANGGGLSSILIPYNTTVLGTVAAVGAIGMASMGAEGVKGHNRIKMGKVSYGGGPARMTGSFTSGAVEAMNNAADGNYQVFSDMASHVINKGGYGKLETYGATPELVSALYGMGGR